MSILRRGHAPGHVRDAFLSAIDAYMAWESGEPEPTVEYQVHYVPSEIPISKACTLVWNCTDIMPGRAFSKLRDDLGLDVKRSTYAACARALHSAIQTTNNR
jgi:hypothetical protein